MPLETASPLPDRRVLRAARSLYTNQQWQRVIEARIARASDVLTGYLGMCGLAVATIGAYTVSAAAGELSIAPLPSVDATQLELPDAAHEEAASSAMAFETAVDLAAGDDGLPASLLAPHDVVRDGIAEDYGAAGLVASALSEHAHLLARAAERKLPCPWCGQPLSAEQFQLGGAAEVRLFCTTEGCGFEEF